MFASNDNLFYFSIPMYLLISCYYSIPHCKCLCRFIIVHTCSIIVSQYRTIKFVVVEDFCCTDFMADECKSLSSRSLHFLSLGKKMYLVPT